MKKQIVFLPFKNSWEVALKKIIIPFASVLIFLFTGCGHTNELANYDLQSKTFHFEDGVAGGAQQVQVDFTTPLGTKKSLFQSGGFSAALDVAEAVGSVVSAVVSSETAEKLVNSVDPAQMAYYVSEGIERTLTRFYDIKSVESQDEAPMFIVETVLTKCKLGSSDLGVSILVEATSRIIDRKTAKIVWEYEGTNIVPIRKSTGSFDRTTNTVASVIGAAQLATLSEEEIQNSVYDAAAGAGALIAEVLREDISKTR